MIDRYIYFQTDSGFNDLLCCMTSVLTYCKKYNRKILLDTVHSSFRVVLSEYFDICDPYIICNMDTIKTICEHESSILPDVGVETMTQILYGDIKLLIKGQNTIFSNGFTSLNLETLPKYDVPQTIILVGITGGGVGYPMFRTFKPVMSVKTYCLEKYSQLKQPYLCIQIRNTDHRCNYQGLYEQNKQLIHSYGDIYIATDDKLALDYFRTKSLNVVNFTQFAEGGGPLHLNESLDPHRRMMNLICDIYIIAMAKTVLSNSDGCFIHLVKTCNQNKHNVAEQFRI
jgi:hypothetical protein